MVFGRNDDLIWFLNNFPKNRHSWLVFVKICNLGLYHSLENECRCLRPFSIKGPGHHHPFLGHVGLEVILTWMTNSPHLTIQNAPKSRVQLLPGAGGGHNLCVSASAALEANFSKLSIWQSNWLKIKILLCKWVSGSSKILSELKSSKTRRKSISKIIFVFYYLRG